MMHDEEKFEAEARRARRMRVASLTGNLLGALMGLAVWVPVAYHARGYWALGGEVFLIGLWSALGSWALEFWAAMKEDRR